jgi:nucleoside-diphosphate-sugar epimerase
LNTLDSAIRHGVKQYWSTSSSEVYQTPPVVPTDETVPISIPNPLNPRYSYAGGKAISELLAINYGKDAFERTVLVRPHNVYGPDMGWEHVIPEFILRAHKLAQEQPVGRIQFPIQGDGTQTRSFDYITDFTAGCLLAFTKGEKVGIYHVGSMEERSIADVVHATVGLFGREADLVFGKLPEGGTNRRCPDTAKIEALGHKPKVSFDEGLRFTADWYLANLNLAP